MIWHRVIFMKFLQTVLILLLRFYYAWSHAHSCRWSIQCVLYRIYWQLHLVQWTFHHTTLILKFYQVLTHSFMMHRAQSMQVAVGHFQILVNFLLYQAKFTLSGCTVTATDLTFLKIATLFLIFTTIILWVLWSLRKW